jgi:hypothetical protein
MARSLTRREDWPRDAVGVRRPWWLLYDVNQWRESSKLLSDQPRMVPRRQSISVLTGKSRVNTIQTTATNTLNISLLVATGI